MSNGHSGHRHPRSNGHPRHEPRYRIVVRLRTRDLRAYEGERVVLHFSHLIGGRPGHPTPIGRNFHITTIDRHHVSNLYNAPMPYSCFFAPAIAFHEGSVTQPSHGCIHLLRADARRLFNWVENHTRHHHRIRVEVHP